VDRFAISIFLVLLTVGCARKAETNEADSALRGPGSNAVEVVAVKNGATNDSSKLDTEPIVEQANVEPSNAAPPVVTEKNVLLEAGGPSQTNEVQTTGLQTNIVAKPKSDYPAQEIYERGLAELKGAEDSDRKAGERALGFFREAAEAGNPPAQHALGVSYLAGIGVKKNIEQGLVWLNKSAAQGYANAQFKLASLYIRGDVVPTDMAKALDFAQKAADQGHAEAQYNLGTMYAMGKGVPKDVKAAAEWFRKAAEAGHATAQSNLGVLYASGDVLEKNATAAIEWWRKAAVQGQPSAQFNLAQALVEGKSVPKDLVEAYKWYHLAAERGDRDAARMRNALGVELSPEEVAEALKRAREFKAQLQAEQKEKRELAF
jgi:TPR repeat protein